MMGGVSDSRPDSLPGSTTVAAEKRRGLPGWLFRLFLVRRLFFLFLLMILMASCTGGDRTTDVGTSSRGPSGVTLIPGGSPLSVNPAAIVPDAPGGTIESPFEIGDGALQGISYAVPGRSTRWSVSIDRLATSSSETGTACLIVIGHATVLGVEEGGRSSADDTPHFFAALEGVELETSAGCDSAFLEDLGYRPLPSLTLPIGAEVGFYYELALPSDGADLVGLGELGEPDAIVIDATPNQIGADDIGPARVQLGGIAAQALGREETGHYTLSYASPLHTGTISDGEVLAVVELEPGQIPATGSRCFGIVGVVTATTIATDRSVTAAIDAPAVSITSNVGVAPSGYLQCDTAPLSSAGYLPATSYEVEQGESFAFFVPVFLPDEVTPQALIMTQREMIDVLYELVLSDQIPPAP